MICNNYKLKAPLGNTGTVGDEVGNRPIKVKIYIEGKNSGQYSFIPTTLNKEITHIFNLTTPKEDIMHILYVYVIFKS